MKMLCWEHMCIAEHILRTTPTVLLNLLSEQKMKKLQNKTSFKLIWVADQLINQRWFLSTNVLLWTGREGVLVVYLTSLRECLDLTRVCLPLTDGSTWVCGPSDNEEHLTGPYIPQDEFVEVPPTDNIGVSGGVGCLNRPRASRFWVAALWPLPPLAPLSPRPLLACAAAVWTLPPRPPLAYTAALLPFTPVAMLKWMRRSLRWGMGNFCSFEGIGDRRWLAMLTDGLGRPVGTVFLCTGPLVLFPAVSHCTTFTPTPKPEKGVAQLKYGGVVVLSNS
jgi:hypothetical protein